MEEQGTELKQKEMEIAELKQTVKELNELVESIHHQPNKAGQ